MANKMLSNIQSLTSGVSTLTQKVNELYAAVDKVAGVAEGAVSGVQGMLKTNGGAAHLATATTRPGTGADGARFAAGAGGMPNYSNMEQSMGTFGGSPASQARGSGSSMGGMLMTAQAARMGGVSGGRIGGAMAAAGAGQALFGLAAGAYAATPDLNLTMSRALGYYQAGLTMPGISRSQLQRATFSAMGGGLSSVGSDALVSAILAGRGVSPGGADYLQLSREVGGAFRYLGIENAPAAQSLAGLRAGPMAANLYQYGITTYDEQGRMRGTGDIARQLIDRFTAGRGYSSVEALNESLYRGFLGANIRSMGFDEVQQKALLQSMRDITMGGTGDLSTSKPLGENQNTMLTAQGRLNASQTELMMRGESSMIRGFENSADIVEAFNRQMQGAIEQLGYLKGVIGGVTGTNVGQGLAVGVPSILGGIKKIAGGIMVAAGVGASIVPGGAAAGIPLALGGAALMASGGGRVGFGSGFNAETRTKGGANANPLVTAGFGAKSGSGIWNSTGGVHKGQDYEMPIGSPVVAALSGVVSSTNPGSEYGNGVIIDHGNGLQTVYGHLSSKNVNIGDLVSTGQRIGRSGATGNVTGPHLHFEVRQGKNNPVDPSVITNVGGIDPTSMYRSQQKSSYLTTPTTSGSSKEPSDVTYVGIQGTKKEAEWARDLLTSLGAPHSDSNVSAITTWMRHEGGGGKTTGIGVNSAMYNPLNTTLDRPGATAMNSVGVKRYLSWEQGMNATVSTLLGNRADQRGYSAIVQALQSDAGVSAVLNAINNSAWRSGKVNDPGYKFPTGGGATGYGASFSSSGTSSTENNVYITVKYDNSDSAAAMKLAKMVEGYLKNGMANSAIGGS